MRKRPKERRSGTITQKFTLDANRIFDDFLELRSKLAVDLPQHVFDFLLRFYALLLESFLFRQDVFGGLQRVALNQNK